MHDLERTTSFVWRTRMTHCGCLVSTLSTQWAGRRSHADLARSAESHIFPSKRFHALANSRCWTLFRMSQGEFGELQAGTSRSTQVDLVGKCTDAGLWHFQGIDTHCCLWHRTWKASIYTTASLMFSSWPIITTNTLSHPAYRRPLQQSWSSDPFCKF